jgi:ketosteroid isomerase-like protein
MPTQLPAVIAAFIQAQNDHDSSALVACVTDDALVYDDGSEVRGKLAIQEWSDRNNRDYNNTIDVANIAHQNNEVIVTATVTGTFEGSPLQFQYHFTVSGNKIVRLSVRE